MSSYFAVDDRRHRSDQAQTPIVPPGSRPSSANEPLSPPRNHASPLSPVTTHETHAPATLGIDAAAAAAVPRTFDVLSPTAASPAEASPGTPAGPSGHQFPAARPPDSDVYVSYRRQYQDEPAQREPELGGSGYDSFPGRRRSTAGTPSYTASSASSYRRASTPLQFPPMPPDLLGPSLQPFARGGTRPQQPLPVLTMPSMPPTPAPPTPAPRAAVPRQRPPLPPMAARVPVYQPPPPPAARFPEQQPQSAARFLAIGIDFGTTYSGVSWALSEKPDDIREIKHFPHLGTGGQRDDMQVPTLYDEQSGRWGHQVAHTAATLKWFKLLLLRDEDLGADVRHSPYVQGQRAQVRQRLDEDGVVDLVAAYLGRLWQHSLVEIGMQIPAEYLRVLPFKVALTVPAIWKPYARTLMAEAARRARITAPRADGDGVAETVLLLVDEPEAAAVSTLLDRRELPDLAVGDTCVVCDCGGGTVDIISYQLRSRAPQPFVLCEAAGGDGRLCGAFLVDGRFDAHVRRQPGVRFADVPAADYQRFVNDEWEHALKRSFCDADGMTEYHVHPPNSALSRTARLRRKDTLVLDKDTVRGFFQPTLDGIYALINEQYRAIVQKEGKPPRKIILVGGLGNSKYLYEQLQNTYHNVVQPDRCWSAVATGAVVKLLKNLFSQAVVAAAAGAAQRRALRAMPALAARVARCSYGVQTGVPVAEADPPRQPGERVIDEPGAQPRVWRMQWYLRRGELVDNRDPVTYCFFDYVRRSTPPARKVEIYTSLQMPPPRIKDASCRRLCTLACAYDVPFDDLPAVPGHPRLRVVQDIRLAMRFEGQIEWRLHVGKRTVSEKMPVEFE